jgi:hypothetical protein
MSVCQNAELMYRSTDWLIDVINNHTSEWGVHAQYGTPSEYLRATRADAEAEGTVFPVKANGSHFFTYNGSANGAWSGYFTSRPGLKGHARQAEAQLHAAEALFALHHPAANAARQDVSGAGSGTGAGAGAGAGADNATGAWALLETARRNNGIVQHHDAITGTECANEEGCAGINQVIGAHNVLADYGTMLSASMDGTQKVIEAALGASAAGGKAALSMDVSDLGNLLMGQGDGGRDALLVVYNPLGSRRTEMVTVAVPVCAIDVFDADTGARVLASQVTAAFGISDGQAPFYDFELQFEASALPALGFRRFRLSPQPDGACGGNERSGGATFVTHERRHPPPAAAEPACDAAGHLDPAVLEEALRRQGAVMGDPRRWERILAEVTADKAAHDQAAHQPQEADTAASDAASGPAAGPANGTVVMSNAFLNVYVDLRFGVQAVYDKASGKNYSLRDELVEYKTIPDGMVAYSFTPAGPATPLLFESGRPGANCTSWRQTANCDATGTVPDHAHDQPCDLPVHGRQSGYCDCAGQQVGIVGCNTSRSEFTCTQVCDPSAVPSVTALAATVALGPVMHEVRLQISDQHKTRIRLWQSADPNVGGRLEFAHRIGVLEPQTDVATRWVLGDKGGTGTDALVLFSEDNGLEVIPHRAGTGADSISSNLFPSQMSAFIASDSTQLSVALDRAHAVGSLQNGTLEVVQHRRGGPHRPTNLQTEVGSLDDTSRIFTQSWISVGNRTASNRQRVSMRQRLNHPLLLVSAAFDPAAKPAPGVPNGIASLPPALHLQSVRATSAANRELLLRLQHMYTLGEDPELSRPQDVDVARVLSPYRPVQANVLEVTLDGMRNVSSMDSRVRFPAEGGEGAPASASEREGGGHPAGKEGVEVAPFELRTFRLTA